ncbi:cuticle protein 8 [Helicoverpa armigera]|uniref:cuticle protein 8 n=1 Tax=Helicoverpa armigera TaxID=29058 RepID=UPI0030837BFC
MFSKIVALCGLVAVCQAGLLPAPVHYSSAAAVSSQNIVRHDQPAVHAAPVAYHAAPAAVAYHAAPAVAYHAAPVVARAEELTPKLQLLCADHTGDNKSAVRDDVVKDSYFHEADGSIRTVEYSADDHHGFRCGAQHRPTAAPVLVKAAPRRRARPPLRYLTEKRMNIVFYKTMLIV